MEKHQNVLRMAGIICSAIVVILAAAQLMGIWQGAGIVYVPLMGVVMVLQALMNWNRNRVVAGLSMVAGVVILGISLYVVVASFL